MSDVKIFGRRSIRDGGASTRRQSSRAPARPRSFQSAEDCIYLMPTVEDVVARGYPASKWHAIKANRDEFIRRFNSDPAFAELARSRAREDA